MINSENQKSNIKVCHVITRMIIGGAQENTLYSVLGLSETPGYEVTLITGPTLGPEGKIEIPEKRSFRLIEIPTLVRAINPIMDVIGLVALWRIFKHEKFHIVHTHSSKAGILGRIAAKLAGIPVIIHTIHGLAFHPFQSNLLNKFYKWIEKWVGTMTTKFITVADAMAREAMAAGISSSDRYVTVRSALDLDGYMDDKKSSEGLKEKYGIQTDDIVVGKIARLFPLKGHEYLLEIASRVVKCCSSVKFIFVGDGVLRESLEKGVQDHGLKDYFVFTGLVQPEEIPAYIGIMDVLVHVSLREGLAKAIPQAFALKKPVVCFDLDGSKELVEDGVTGYLVPVKDTSVLADRLVRLVNDGSLRERMGQAGFERLMPDYKKEYMVQKIHQIYQRCLKCG